VGIFTNMLLQNEFYFVRHGQTDHNAIEGYNKGDHPEDIPLNETGRNQAKLIEPLIATLPVQTVCASPLRRAQETKEIITSNLQALHHNIDDLGECSANTWFAMREHGMNTALPKEGPAREFMIRVRNGVNLALLLPSPTLIVAHGGVHWAICCLMGIEEHDWAIDNCVPVHFTIQSNGKWSARKL
jgi:uncharacterized phosphatase